MKKVLVLGGGGFIGGHLAKRLKNEGCWVRVVDIKPKHEYWDLDDICNDYISCDLTDPKWVEAVMRLESFSAPALVLKIGEATIKMPVDWQILIGEKEHGDLETLPLTSINDTRHHITAFKYPCTSKNVPLGSIIANSYRPNLPPYE